MPQEASKTKHIIIVGAGLSGALMACYLGRLGHCVEVYERREDPRSRGFIGGRSINLALSCRGITALSKVGLSEKVLDGVIPMRGRMMHDPRGRLTFQPYSKNPADAINSVSRGGLNLTMLEAADAFENVTLHFGARCVDVDLDRPAAEFVREGTDETFTAGGDLIIGADGAFSAVRARMQVLDRFDYRQDYLAHGYKELTIPPNAEGRFAMEPNALHIWPRPRKDGGFMMIALPNQDKTFTCTCFWPFTGPTSFASIRSSEDVKPFFEEHFPDAVTHIPTLVDDFMTNPTSSLATVRCAPWHYSSGGQGKVVLIGDAAHAVVPFYGQGINAGFEDVRILDDCLRKHEDDWAIALAEYSEQRKPHADAIADLALSNFIEMRDKVSSKRFLLRKKLEKTVHRLLPGWYTPLYNLVSFSNVPYAEARWRARRQWAIITSVLAFAGAAAAVLLLWAAMSLWGGPDVPLVGETEDTPAPQPLHP